MSAADSTDPVKYDPMRVQSLSELHGWVSTILNGWERDDTVDSIVDDIVSLIEDDRRAVIGGLHGLRASHRFVEDCWYSCPKSEDGCCNEAEGDECNCGADTHNARVDELIQLALHGGEVR